MRLHVYNEILDVFHSLNSRIKISSLSKLFPDIPVKTLGSIYSQDYQRKTKKLHWVHHNEMKIEEYYDRFLKAVDQGEEKILLRLADEIDDSPALLAKFILEKYVSETQCDGEAPARGVTTQLMRDTYQIEHPQLSTEVMQCVLADDMYGPIADTVKHSIGHEHEVLLMKYLEQYGLTYLGEDQLRSKGYDKTPDIKLEVPIAVDGFVINWIESKASFGDEISHKAYLKDQFWSYWNRFGSGLVIYWFGFIEELNCNRDKGILLMDHFPTDVKYMNPTTLDEYSFLDK